MPYFRLEDELRAELEDAREVSRAKLEEIGTLWSQTTWVASGIITAANATHGTRRCTPLRVVEDVEGLCAELEVCLFRDAECPRQ